MPRQFHNRTDELRFFEERFNSNRAEFIVLYGRRRIGKTELILESAGDRRHLYFEATAGTSNDHLSDISLLLAEISESPLLQEQELSSWRAVLAAIEAELERGPLVVTLDEFQFVARESPEIGSEINRFWRRRQGDANLTLILSGSDVSFFEDEVLSYSAVTYGRRTASLRLTPFPAAEVRLFAPKWQPEDHLRAYAVFGGIPYYLENLDAEQTLAENILRLVLSPDGLLHEEPHFLLAQHTELRSIGLYLSTLRAIAAGRTKRNEIAQRVGRRDDQTGEILTRLIQMRLVRREHPVTVVNPERSKIARYTISDPFLRFWFRFVQPHVNRLHSHESAQRHLCANVMPALDQFVSFPAFEEVCRNWLERQLPDAGVGRWWGSVKEGRRGETKPVNVAREVDLVGLDDEQRVIALGSCKWQAGEMTLSDLREVKRLAPKIGPSVPGSEPAIYLFSRSGFTADLREASAAQGCHLLEVADLL